MFNLSCISFKEPLEVISEILKAIRLCKLKHVKVGEYAVNCQKQNIKFEMEAVVMEDADFLTMIKFKRVAGEVRGYKETVSKLLSQIQL